MKIESSIVRFHPQCQFAQLNLSDLQQQYLADLLGQSTIREISLRYLQMGWLMNFHAMYQLVSALSQHDWIMNPEFKKYFNKTHKESFTDLKVNDHRNGRHLTNQEIKLASEFPFFRSLPPDVRTYLLQKGELYIHPAETLICQEGEKDRSLYVLLQGQVALYKSIRQHKRFLALIKETSVFGENGFFLGVPRSADIITTKSSEILKIPCEPAVIDKLINQEKVQTMIHRFWVQQSLQSSDFFKNFPSDCLDTLTHTGELVRLPEKQVLFYEGDTSDAAYIVVQGQLSVLVQNKSVGIAKQGHFVGEISLLFAQGQRTATLIADRDTILVKIKRQLFYELLADNLYLAKELQALAQERILKNQK